MKCTWCGGPMPELSVTGHNPKRPDAKTCSKKCRQRQWRACRRQASVARQVPVMTDGLSPAGVQVAIPMPPPRHAVAAGAQVLADHQVQLGNSETSRWHCTGCDVVLPQLDGTLSLADAAHVAHAAHRRHLAALILQTLETTPCP